MLEGQMTDQELRDRMLQSLYDQRHNKNGLVTLPAGLSMSDVQEHVLANILRQLRDKGLAKWHRTAGGPCRGAANVTTDGIHEIESRQNFVIPPIEIAGSSVPTAHPTHTLIAWLTFAIIVILVIAGIALVVLGAKGNTTFSFFGNDFSSENVGIVALALAVLMVILNFRRLLKSVERLRD